MALVCDTGGIYALYDADDVHHQVVKEAVTTEVGPLIVPVVLLAEIDYLLHFRLGTSAAIDFAESIQQGAFTLCGLTSDDLIRCIELMRQYRDLSLGLADASVVAIAERLRLQRILTVDHRHFRTIRPKRWASLVIVPGGGE